MTKSNLLKDPVLKNKINSKVNNPAGDISNEIKEQDLNGQAGGSTPACVSAATAVTALSAWANDKITQKYHCGSLATVSAECRS
ncbi:plantaricin C family lantibiotic, partial [Clostridium saccharobutylicum]